MDEHELKKRIAEFLRFQGELGLWGLKIAPRSLQVKQKEQRATEILKKTGGPPLAEAPLAKTGAVSTPSSAYTGVRWSGSTKSRDEIEKELQELGDEIGDCTRCRLHTTRKTIVFGHGNPKTNIVFIGEGPGEEEDKQGLPFVGRAGQLLDKIIAAMGLSRQSCYICNVVKCRPPDNRTPLPDEQSTCGQFLRRQLEIMEPAVIVALGVVSANYLLSTQMPIGRMRSRFWQYEGAKLMPTYHPSYLLRNESGKAAVWEDMKLVMAELGLKDPRKK